MNAEVGAGVGVTHAELRAHQATRALLPLHYTPNCAGYGLANEASEVENNGETISKKLVLIVIPVIDTHRLKVFVVNVCIFRGPRRKFMPRTAPSGIPSTHATQNDLLTLGGMNTVFAPCMARPAICARMNSERRYATMEDFRNLAKLTYLHPGLHHSGGTICEPVDLPVTKRHLEMIYAHQRFPITRVHT